MSHSGKDYTKAAEQHGLRIKSGKGDHVVVYGPAGRGMMVVPMHKQLATGTDHSINKWFKAHGIVVVGLIVVYLASGATAMASSEVPALTSDQVTPGTYSYWVPGQSGIVVVTIEWRDNDLIMCLGKGIMPTKIRDIPAGARFYRQ